MRRENQSKIYGTFGMEMVGKNYSSNSYRYGFNGKEKDDEIKGASGTSYDYGARIYDARVARWLATEPLYRKYPSLSTYAFVANMPISAIDPDGKKIKIISTDPIVRAQIFADLQKITSTQLVLLVNGQVIESAKAVGFPKSFIESTGVPTKTLDGNGNEIPKIKGTELLANAINDVNTAKITGVDSKHPANATTEFTNVAAAQGLVPGGSGSTIYYDKDKFGESIVNEDNSTGRSPQSGLAHEVGHAVSAMEGAFDIRKDPDYIDPDSNCPGLLMNEEIRNRKEVDNPVRYEQGDQQRATPQKNPK